MNSVKTRQQRASLKKEKLKRTICQILGDEPQSVSSDEESDDDTEMNKSVENESEDSIVESLIEENPKDTDDIVVTKVQYKFVDPVTKTKILEPIKNKICNHIYEKASILQIISSAVQSGKKVRCPYGGCIATKFDESHLIVDEETETIKKSQTSKNKNSRKNTKSKRGKKPVIDHENDDDDDITTLEQDNNSETITEIDDVITIEQEVINVLGKETEPTVTSLVNEITSLKSFAVKIMKCMESMQQNMKGLEKELEKVKNEACGLSVCRRNDKDDEKDNLNTSSINDKSLVEVDDGQIIDKQNENEIYLEEWGDKESSKDCSEINEDDMKSKKCVVGDGDKNDMKDLVNYIKKKDGIFDEIDEALKSISDEKKLDKIVNVNSKSKRKLKHEDITSTKKLCGEKVKNTSQEIGHFKDSNNDFIEVVEG